MAITAVDISYEGQGPNASGQITEIQGVAGNLGRMLIGQALITGDAATTTAVIQLVPGTSGAGTLAYTPTFCSAQRGPGGADASAFTLYCSAITNAAATVKFSAAPAASTTQILLFIAP